MARAHDTPDGSRLCWCGEPMDLVAGGVLHGRLPIRPLRFPLVLRSLPSPAVAVSAALPGCPCPPIVRRNAPAVVPSAKKKRKGYRDDPPDEEAADGLVDEWEEDEEVEEGEDFHDDDEGNNGFRELQFQCCLFFAMMMMIGTWEFRVLSALAFGERVASPRVCISDLFLGSPCLRL